MNLTSLIMYPYLMQLLPVHAVLPWSSYRALLPARPSLRPRVCSSSDVEFARPSIHRYICPSSDAESSRATSL